MVLLDYTKLVSKVLKLYMRQRLGQHICNMFIYAHIMEFYGSSLHHIMNEVILDFYVLRLVKDRALLPNINSSFQLELPFNIFGNPILRIPPLCRGQMA